MSQTKVSRNSPSPTKGTGKSKVSVKPSLLNLRNLPTQISGFPEVLFTKYSVELVITGPGQVTPKLRALNEEGLPGKYVQMEDALRLCRAAGFVRASDKEVSRSVDTEKTRLLFHQAKFNEKKVPDPKSFTKKILSFEENLNKSRAALERADDAMEDLNAKSFLTAHINLAENVLDTYITEQNAGKKRSIREVAFEYGLPASMVSKTLTGSVEVPQNGRLWTALCGRELEKFCQLTLKEIKHFEEENLLMYLTKEQIEGYRALCEDQAVQAAFGTTKPLSENQKEKYFLQPMPIKPIVGMTAMLRRAETTRASVRMHNEKTAVFPKISAIVNKTLGKHYILPPADMSLVRDYWNALSDTNLLDPDLASASYRVQALEALEENGKRPTIAMNEYSLINKEYKWNGMPLHIMTEKLRSDKILDMKLEKYQPPEIVGFDKEKPSKKSRARANAIRKNELTAKNQRYMRALKKKGVPPKVMDSVKEFLESFLYIDMQELAGHVVYMTCQLSPNEAKKIVLNEEEDDEAGSQDRSSEEETDEDNNDEGDEDEDDPLPEPLPPPEGDGN